MTAAIKLLPTGDVYYGVAIASGAFRVYRASVRFGGALCRRRVAACTSACLWMFDTARHTAATWTLSRKANCSSCQIFAGARALQRVACKAAFLSAAANKAAGDHFFCFLRILSLATSSPSPLIYIAPRRLWIKIEPTYDFYTPQLVDRNTAICYCGAQDS